MLPRMRIVASPFDTRLPARGRRDPISMREWRLEGRLENRERGVYLAGNARCQPISCEIISTKAVFALFAVSRQTICDHPL